MTDEPRSGVARFTRAAAARACALAVAITRLGAGLARTLAHARSWLRRTRAFATDRASGPAAAVSAAPPRPRAPSIDRLLPPEVDSVEVQPDFGETHYATVFRRLQLGPRCKLFDLRAARTLKVDLFDRLAIAWQAAPGTVPKLAIMLGYESWAVLHNVAARRLRPLADQGVTVELFYAQQVDRLPVWFARGRVYHNLPAILVWLRTEWRGTTAVPPLPVASDKAQADKLIAIWPAVLRTTAKLAETHAPVEDVPELLLELAALARSFGDAEGNAEAVKHLHTALHWIGDAPSAVKCRALRALALAKLARGEVADALTLFDTAVTLAMVIADRIEGASALAELGLQAMRTRHFARAERRFRRAVALMTDKDPEYLRAMLHHQLALALHAQGKHGNEAAQHASAALALRWDPGSRLASDDRKLLAAIEARRPSCNPPHNPITSRDTEPQARHEKPV